MSGHKVIVSYDAENEIFTVQHDMHHNSFLNKLSSLETVVRYLKSINPDLLVKMPDYNNIDDSDKKLLEGLRLKLLEDYFVKEKSLSP